MRKTVLFSLALCVSFNAFAAATNNNLADAVAKNLGKQNSSQKGAQNSAIYYGGKDISHPLVASNSASKAGSSFTG